MNEELDCFKVCGWEDLECHYACIDRYVDSFWKGDDEEKKMMKALLKMHAFVTLYLAHAAAALMKLKRVEVSSE